MACCVFIPSYHRARNLKTVKFLKKIGYRAELIHVFIDDEAEDGEEYREECERAGCRLHVFSMEEARARYDYVHRPSQSRRSAGQARNTFQDYAKKMGVDFYCVIDDDCAGYEVRKVGVSRVARPEEVIETFEAVEEMMRRRHIGVFGLPQSGDNIGGVTVNRVWMSKVMNTTFYYVPYVYRAERGVQDDDTSMFANMWNVGLFTGSLGCGLTLHQQPSAEQEGGLTDLYNECRLLNKALVVPIQIPSAVRAEKQKMNGGRLHHRINYRYLAPKILRNPGGRDNLAWDSYPEDWPFTLEPRR